MSLAANALTSWATVKAELGCNDAAQAVVERLINVASEAIEAYCGRGFVSLQRVEKLPPSGGRRLVLSCVPVTAVASIMVDGAAFTDFEIEDAAAGILWSNSGWPSNDRQAPGVSCATLPGSGKRSVVVTYTGGATPPPYEIEQACIDTVTSLYRRRGADKAAAGYGDGNAQPTYYGGVLPGYVLPTLNRYRRLVT